MASPGKQLVEGDPGVLPSSDDSTILELVKRTHTPDGHNVDVRYILDIVEDVFNIVEDVRYTPPNSDDSDTGESETLDMQGETLDMQGETLDMQGETLDMQGETLDMQGESDERLKSMDDKLRYVVLKEHGTIEALAFIIKKVSCEITYKCGGGDAHDTTMSLLHMLSNYSWEAKVVITLAALATIYTEFSLVVQFCRRTHPLAKYVTIMKQLPDLIEHPDALNSRFDALAGLVSAMIDVTRGVIEFSLMPTLPNAMTDIPTATYWTMRSVVACASFIDMSVEHVSSTTEECELLSLAKKERNIHDHLMQQLALCELHSDEEQHTDSYNNLVRLFEIPPHDNIRIIKHLIYPKNETLHDGCTNKEVDINELKRKTVVLMISDLDVAQEELEILNQIFEESRDLGLQYEMVWIPIVDHSIPWKEEQQQSFEQRQSIIEFYTIHDPKLMEPGAIRYMKEVWRFQKRTVLVVLDPYGKVASQNALHMMLIWWNHAYPFTDLREETLWREESETVGLFWDDIYEWILEGNHVCVYGGGDIYWIDRFGRTTKQLTDATGIDITLLYVGKKNASNQQMSKITDILDNPYLIEPANRWIFWRRLECLLYSKMKFGMNSETDRVMQQVMTMLSYDASDQGWAIILDDSSEMAKALGDTMLESLSKFEEWKENARSKGFVPALREYLLQHQTPHICTRITLPRNYGGIPERVVCGVCGRAMETYVMYRCCTD